MGRQREIVIKNPRCSYYIANVINTKDHDL